MDDVGTIATSVEDEHEMARKKGLYMDTNGLEAKQCLTGSRSIVDYVIFHLIQPPIYLMAVQNSKTCTSRDMIELLI